MSGLKFRSLWKKLIPVAAILAVIGAVAGILVAYFNFISAQIRIDSERQLKEVYEQVNNSFGSFLNRNWDLLGSCNDYFMLVDGQPDERKAGIDGFLEEKKAAWSFTDFYFLTTDKQYRSAGGKSGVLRPEGEYDKLISDKKPVMAGETIDGEKVTVFAVASEGDYGGFAYDAIGLSYTNTDIAKALNANAFEGEANCYILRPDGGVLLSTAVGGGAMRNYFSYLGNWLDDDTYAAISGDIAAGKEGFFQGDIGGETRSIIYMPIGYEDFALLSDVPLTAVSRGFLTAQRTTMIVLLITFFLIVAALITVLAVRLIMQSRRSKQELQYRERMFDVLSNNVDDIFLMLDPDSETVDYVSPNVDRLLGVRAKDVKSGVRALAACVVDEEAMPSDEKLRAIPLGEQESREFDYAHLKSGERRRMRVTIYHMSIWGKEKFIVVMSDRTLERQLNLKLQDALDAAKSANEAKSNFLSNMSHDIRTPMNAIVGFAQLLEKHSDDPKTVRDYSHKITASSRHLLSLINDVLDMSKIESGKTSLNVNVFAVNEILEELDVIISPQARAKNQKFKIVKGDLPENISGDKLRVSQILLNLLSNAVKYTPEHGNIELKAERADGAPERTAKIRFTVKDDGIGMSEEFQKDIFKPFSREKNPLVNEVQGTGLGMAITKNLVDLMGGVITLDSRPGKGSLFTVELTFALADEKSLNTPEAETEYPDALAGRMFLVAEDNQMNAEILTEMLRMEEARCEVAPNGKIAVEMFRRSAPKYYDAIFMDMQMPVMNGREAVKAIRASAHPDARRIPIIAMTANTFAEDVRDALDAGMDAHLSKPIDMSAVKKTVGNLLNKYRYGRR